MSTVTPLDQALNKLRENGYKVNEIYEAVGKDKMEHYNILRSNNEFRQKAYLNQLIEVFPDLLGNMSDHNEESFQDKYIKALERENALLQKQNNEAIEKILQELQEIKKRLKNE